MIERVYGAILHRADAMARSHGGVYPYAKATAGGAHTTSWHGHKPSAAKNERDTKKRLARVYAKA